MTNYKTIDELPACLSVTEVATYLRISKPIAYQLIHRADFPAVKVGEKRYVVPKDRLIKWMSREGAAM